jgi:hypothetical protein
MRDEGDALVADEPEVEASGVAGLAPEVGPVEADGVVIGMGVIADQEGMAAWEGGGRVGRL